MMEKYLQYRREMNRSYVVVSEITEETAGEYRYQMVLHNQISGLLPCTERYPEGERSLYFDISSKQSLEQFYEGRKLNMRECTHLLETMVQSLKETASYLLDENCLSMDPEQIFTDAREEEILYLFCPFHQEQNYGRMADFLLAHVDHKDEQAVDLAYRFYQESKSPCFSIEGFMGSMETGEKVEEAGFRKEITWEAEKTEKRENTEEEDIFLSAGSEKPADKRKTEETAKKRKLLFLTGGIFFLSGGFVLSGKMEGIAVNGAETGYHIPPWTGAVLLGIGICILAAGIYFEMKIRTTKESSNKKGMGKSGDENAGKNRGGHLTGLGEGKEGKEGRNIDWEFCGNEITSEEGDETVFLDQAEEYLGSLQGEDCGKQINYMLSMLPVTVGKMREKADIILMDNSVSRIHARISLVDGCAAVADMNSRNGTFINGERLEIGETRKLQKGDSIRFGRVELHYC